MLLISSPLFNKIKIIIIKPNNNNPTHTSHTHFVIATCGESLTISAAIRALLKFQIALHRLSLLYIVLHRPSHLLVHPSSIHSTASVPAAPSEAAKEQGEKD